MGITDFEADLLGRRIWRPGDSIIFAATGVTDGTLMRGVRFFGDGIRTSSVVMQNDAAPDPLHRHHSRATGRMTTCGFGSNRGSDLDR